MEREPDRQREETGKPPVEDLFSDLCDGRRLLELLEGLAGRELVKDVMKDVMAGLQQTNSEKILLSWVRQNTRQYPQVGSFTDARLDHGRGFAADPESENSKCRRPELFDWSAVEKKTSAIDRLEHAFSTAEQHLRTDRLLDPEDVAVPHPDKKSVIMYVTSLFQVLPQSVSMEAIKEVETLPRGAAAAVAANARKTTDEHYQIQTQQRFSQQGSPKSCRSSLSVDSGIETEPLNKCEKEKSEIHQL
ncbi:hypothetical protein F2P81_002805 [Scophthalmus maximus]|uniref:Calponin-homology (CH) domain-containing protein n=1 Tax=Scophthalmus maximus TaxID=52904 RepID=A0A6A4TFE4_SCOMX|nr:hypothetical protein F2P81_002805 [Scophthalmus maximus]